MKGLNSTSIVKFGLSTGFAILLCGMNPAFTYAETVSMEKGVHITDADNSACFTGSYPRLTPYFG